MNQLKPNTYSEPSIERFAQQNQGRGTIVMPKPIEDRRTLQSEVEASRQLRNELETAIGMLYEKLAPILDTDCRPQGVCDPQPSPSNLVEVIAAGNIQLNDFISALRRLNERILL